MKFLRWLIGNVLLFLDKVTSPKPLERSKAEQEKIDELAGQLSIYEFQSCPFCIKVRRYLRKNNVSISLKNAKEEPYRTELLRGGGKVQVPCLKISRADGSNTWMYESSDIIAYLRENLGIKDHLA